MTTANEALIARLMQIRPRIGNMCSEGKPPRMSIPASHDDDDLFICEAVDDAIAALQSAPRAVPEREPTKAMTDAVNTWFDTTEAKLIWQRMWDAAK